MDKTIRINIQVGESRYPIWVDRDEEPLYREAARMVNRRLIAYNTKFRGANLPPEAIMAMAAVDLALKCQRQQQDVSQAEIAPAIADMVADLQQFAESKVE